MKIKKKPEFTIGLIVNFLEDKFLARIIPGILNYAETQNLNIISFAGKLSDTPWERNLQNNIENNFINSGNIDGVICMPENINNYSEYSSIHNFFNHYSFLPIVSLVTPIKNIPSIVIENKQGMRQILVHIIENHNCRKIAFIKGPEVNNNA